MDRQAQLLYSLAHLLPPTTGAKVLYIQTYNYRHTLTYVMYIQSNLP